MSGRWGGRPSDKAGARDNNSSEEFWAKRLAKKQQALPSGASAAQLEGAKSPTLKQVQAAESRYNLYGLKIEQAKAAAGYARGGGKVGTLQAEKGKAYSEFLALKRAYETTGQAYIPV